MGCQEAALGLVRRGLAVFPCRRREKLPLTPHGCLDASREPPQISAWWSRWPDANVAVATGPLSGLFVVDVDVDGEEGEASLRLLEAEHGALPATVEVITGRGRHLWLRLPAAADVRNSAGQLGGGLDVRGAGGYVLAPPSLHPSGRRYAWSVDSAGLLADPPPWLLARVATASEGPRQRSATPSAAWRELAGRGVAEGGRNQALARLAGLLFRALDPLVAVDLLTAWNEVRCRPPLPEAEVRRTLDSVAAAELRRLAR